jgi:hypothetical protein
MNNPFGAAQAVHEQGLRQPSPSPTEERPSLLVAHGSFGDLLPAMNDLTGDIRLLPPPSSALDSPQQQVGTHRPYSLPLPVSCLVTTRTSAHTRMDPILEEQAAGLAELHRRPQLLQALCTPLTHVWGVWVCAAWAETTGGGVG